MAEPRRRPRRAPGPGERAGLDGAWLRTALRTARDDLLAEVDGINDLNVFPVPDGDTGSNLLRTVEAACDAALGLGEGAGLAEAGRAAAEGALMGARGNSGVILSQHLRGFADALPRAAAGGARTAAALAAAAALARRAVLHPQPGTILSVADDAARAARAAGGGDAGAAGVLAAAAVEAWASVERSPAQLPVLAEAGVVDAGGYGLAVLLTAFARAAGASPPRPARPRPAPAGERRGPSALAVPEAGHGYCTEFLIADATGDADRVRRALAAAADLGESALVVGDAARVHVHVHTETPWVVLTEAARLGRIERLTVQDMTTQHRAARREPAPAAGGEVGVVAVAPGPGFRAILTDLGASAVVDGGAGRAPSPEELLAGVRAAGAAATVILPNHPDVLLAARQAARLGGGGVAVVPTRSVPQGIAALLAMHPGDGLAAARQRMERASAGVSAIEIAPAARDATRDGRRIHAGDLLALADGEITAVGRELQAVAIEALERSGAEGRELVTVYRGAAASGDDQDRLAEAIRRRFPELEVETQDGGQPLHPFVISVE